MSEVNFNEEVEQPKAAPKEQTRAVVKHRPVINDYIPSFAEMRLPRINVVQNIGPLQEQFSPGEVVYRQTTILHTPERKGEKGTPPGEVVILGLLPKRWAERVAGGEKGRLVSSPEEARRAGGTTDYDEWKLKKESGLAYFEPLAEFIVLVKQPKHLQGTADAVFPFKVDGDRFALGIWAMKSTAYNNCAKFIFTDRQIGPTLEGGYPSCLYRFHTWLKPFGAGKSSWVPKFEAIGPTSESFQKFAATVIAGASGSDADDTGAAEF